MSFRNVPWQGFAALVLVLLTLLSPSYTVQELAALAPGESGLSYPCLLYTSRCV